MASEGAITPESLQEARKSLKIDQIKQIMNEYNVTQERAKYLLKIQQSLLEQLAKMDSKQVQELDFREILKGRRNSVAPDSDSDGDDSDVGVFLGQLAALMQK